MAHYLSLFVRAVFVENMALAFFWACVRSLPFLKRYRRHLVWAWQLPLCWGFPFRLTTRYSTSCCAMARWWRG